MEQAFGNPWIDFEHRRQEINRHGENSARYASAFGTFRTTGWGEVQFNNCFNFGLTFAERPFVAYSYVVIRNTLVDSDDVLVPTRFPRSFGGVYEWRRNSHGFYTGAWCFCVVDTQSPYITVDPTAVDDPGYVLQHHFTFNGMGIKDLPDYELDQ